MDTQILDYGLIQFNGNKQGSPTVLKTREDLMKNINEKKMEKNSSSTLDNSMNNSDGLPANYVINFDFDEDDSKLEKIFGGGAVIKDPITEFNNFDGQPNY